jgi:hypothetical protein
MWPDYGVITHVSKIDLLVSYAPAAAALLNAAPAFEHRLEHISERDGRNHLEKMTRFSDVGCVHGVLPPVL